MSLEVPELVTMQEVADRLRVSQSLIHRLCQSRQLATFRIGRSVRITAASVDHYLLRNLPSRRPATAPARRAA